MCASFMYMFACVPEEEKFSTDVLKGLFGDNTDFEHQFWKQFFTTMQCSILNCLTLLVIPHVFQSAKDY